MDLEKTSSSCKSNCIYSVLGIRYTRYKSYRIYLLITLSQPLQFMRIHGYQAEALRKEFGVSVTRKVVEEMQKNQILEMPHVCSDQ